MCATIAADPGRVRQVQAHIKRSSVTAPARRCCHQFEQRLDIAFHPVPDLVRESPWMCLGVNHAVPLQHGKGLRRCQQVFSAERDWISVRMSCDLLNADRLTAFFKQFQMTLPERPPEEMMVAFHEILNNSVERIVDALMPEGERMGGRGSAEDWAQR